MYCVFLHITGHLPRQIWFWKISTKTWDLVRPPPLVGPNAQVFPKINFEGSPNDHENDDFGGQAVEIAKGEAAGGFHKGFGQLPEGAALCRPEGEGCNQEI